MKNIILSKNKGLTIVSDSDYEKLKLYKWFLTSHGYVARWSGANTKPQQIFLHRQILSPSIDEQVDHINHDRLDNRRSNLRIVTASQNQHNQQRKGGVHFYKPLKKWVAYTKILGKRKHLGYFNNKNDARKSVDAFVSLIF